MSQKRLEDMTEPELKACITRCCQTLRRELPRGTGFIFLAASFDGKIAQYGGNVERASAAAWMAETIARWDAGDHMER